MIPRTLHQVWIGGPLPEHLAQYGKTWIDHHPEWDYKLWDEQSIEALPMLRSTRHVWDTAEKYATGNGVHQLRVDVARYELLHEHGGVYVDFDFECRKPIDPLLNGRAPGSPYRVDELGAFAAWEVTNRWVNNAIMGAVPGHPLLGLLRVGLAANVETVHAVDPKARPNKLSGPQYLTALLRTQRSAPFVLFAKELFYPYLYNELDRADEPFPDAYAVHHWNNRRQQERTR